MKAFGISDKGAVRSENQDRFRIRFSDKDEFVIAVLCDGMGGAADGALAAEMAADAFVRQAELCLSETDPSEDGAILRQAATAANSEVYAYAKSHPESAGMGATLVGVLLRPESCAVCNVGDSRAYLLHDGVLTQLTRDHSLVQEMVDRRLITPEEALYHPKRNVILRAVGTDRRVGTDLFYPELYGGDRLLLCSDGLSNAISEAQLEAVTTQDRDPEYTVRELLHLALDNGAQDNVTAILLRL